jgi:hypothetical protein
MIQISQENSVGESTRDDELKPMSAAGIANLTTPAEPERMNSHTERVIIADDWRY